MTDPDLKTHFFRDDNDERMVVTTARLPDGNYEAQLICEHPVYGHGDTRMAAIADLQMHIDLANA